VRAWLCFCSLLVLWRPWILLNLLQGLLFLLFFSFRSLLFCPRLLFFT
jgi:hypothetical protein